MFRKVWSAQDGRAEGHSAVRQRGRAGEGVGDGDRSVQEALSDRVEAMGHRDDFDEIVRRKIRKDCAQHLVGQRMRHGDLMGRVWGLGDVEQRWKSLTLPI